MKIRHLLTLGLVFYVTTSSAQKWTNESWGVQVGLSANLGTHITHVGLKIQGYYSYDFIQFNLGNHIRFNNTHLGKRKNFVTQRINTGVVLKAGKKSIAPQLIFDGLNHQSKSSLAIAYNYLWYFDNIGTSQRSGGWGIHIQQFSFLIENDIFAGFGRDRYRTSYAGIAYHDDLYNISLNTQLWTGDTRGTPLLNTPDSIYQKGYKDLSSTHYGKTSHGILSIGIDYEIIYGNHASLVVGIDGEKIRNGLQNKFMHDKKFIPKKWRKPNVNYPMLNIYGMPVHRKEEASPLRFFMQTGLNRSFSY